MSFRLTATLSRPKTSWPGPKSSPPTYVMAAKAATHDKLSRNGFIEVSRWCHATRNGDADPCRGWPPVVATQQSLARSHLGTSQESRGHDGGILDGSSKRADSNRQTVRANLLELNGARERVNHAGQHVGQLTSRRSRRIAMPRRQFH